MSIVCSICQERLTESPHSSAADGFMVALRCGHLFHKYCTDQWFRQRHNCPCCYTPIRIGRDKPLQIYPNCDDYNFEEQARSLRDATRQVEWLSQELSETRARKEQQFRKETRAHDILKVEHVKLQSTLEKHTECSKNLQRIIEKLDERNEALLRKNEDLETSLNKCEHLFREEWKKRRMLEVEVGNLRRRLRNTMPLNNEDPDSGYSDTGSPREPEGLGPLSASVIVENRQEQAVEMAQEEGLFHRNNNETDNIIDEDATFELAIDHAKRSASIIMSYMLAPYRQNNAP